MGGKYVEYAETAIKLQQGDQRKSENTGWMTGENEKMYKWKIVAIRDSLSNLVSSQDEENG